MFEKYNCNNIMFEKYNCNNIFKYYLFLFDDNTDKSKIENKSKNNYDEPVKLMHINR